MSEAFDDSLCDGLPGPLKRVCRGEIGGEDVIWKIRGQVASGLVGRNKREAFTSLAGEREVLRLDAIPSETEGALNTNRGDEFPIAMGHARSGERAADFVQASHSQDGNPNNSSGSGGVSEHDATPALGDGKCKNCDNSKTMSIYDRFTTFVKTQAKTIASGFASDEVVKSRLAICETCPHLKKNHCELCGCKCNGGANFMNKLAHKSASCPDNPPRWGAAE